MKAPCKGCTRRHVGCHADCEDYIKAVRENEELKKQRRAENEFAAYISETYRKAERRWSHD